MTISVAAGFPITRCFDLAGLPLGGGLLFTYQAGSTTPQPTYQDQASTLPNTNPIVLDSTGSAIVRYTAGVGYKLVLTDPTGTTVLATLDNFYAPLTDAATIASLLFPRTSLEIAAGITPVTYLYPPGQFERYGAIGDNAADDSVAIAAAFSTGHLVTGIAGHTYYCGTSTITLATSGVKASLYGVSLRTAVNGTTFLNIIASNIEIRGAQIYGRGNSSYTANEKLITWSGADVNNYVSGLRMTDCYLHDVGAYAIYSQFGQRVFLAECHFKNIGYGAIGVLSGLDWEVNGGIIDTVSPGSTNAYGVIFTRDPTTSDTLTAVPRSKNCKVSGMTVKNITLWAALDTHGGEEIIFANNIIENCLHGVLIGACPGVSTNPLFGPKNCISIGNRAKGTGNGYGVAITGAGTAVGTTIDAATGCASIGDEVIGFGIANSPHNGGMEFYYTQGVQVIAPVVQACLSNAIVMYHDNLGFSVVGGNLIDPYDNTVTDCSGIKLDADYNNGIISGVSFQRVNAALGTTVAARAINGVTVANSTILVGPCYSTFTTYISGIASLAITALTDNSGGTPGNTIPAVPGTYNQATLANQISSLAVKINTILIFLKTAGMTS